MKFIKKNLLKIKFLLLKFFFGLTKTFKIWYFFPHEENFQSVSFKPNPYQSLDYHKI